jgi:hypothetical protein
MQTRLSPGRFAAQPQTGGVKAAPSNIGIATPKVATAAKLNFRHRRSGRISRMPDCCVAKLPPGAGALGIFPASPEESHNLPGHRCIGKMLLDRSIFKRFIRRDVKTAWAAREDCAAASTQQLVE